MDISVKLRMKIENVSENQNIFQLCKTDEELAEEIVVSELSNDELKELVGTQRFRKWRSEICDRIPRLYSFLHSSSRDTRIILILLYNLTTRLIGNTDIDNINMKITHSADIACCLLSYDCLLDVRDWQEQTKTLLGEDKYESMQIFLSLISRCYERATREEYEEFLVWFTKLFSLIEAKKRALTRRPKKYQEPPPPLTCCTCA